MGVTSNGLPYPENSAFVADGAMAIKDLADNVNAKAGLWKIKPTSVSSGSTIEAGGDVSFATQSTISLNGVFTSDFRDYVINLDFETGSTSANAQLRLRTGGSDNNSNLYAYVLQSLRSLDANVQSAFGRTQNIALIQNPANLINTFNYTITMNRPFETKKTTWKLDASNDIGNFITGGGSFNDTTSFDGFSIIASAGNYTGVISVYGYNS
jgi:hypothetical protein